MLLRFVLAIAVSAALALGAEARPAIVIDADSGRVLHAEDATALWYPASLTKLMTTYVTLSAVREGRITLDTPILYSANAQKEPASKMGFPVNTILTIDNALKLLLVKSANDVAVAIAEGVSGSEAAFVAEMNRHAKGLGMTQSRFKNPNGWHDDQQVTSARDMAILGRALFRDFPSYSNTYKIAALQLGKRTIRGHNHLIGRFRGADGMKTGFTCPSGFNLVASATRGKRHLIAVVLGHASAKERTQRAAELLDAGFGKWTFWRRGQEVATLPAVAGAAPNLRPEVCDRKRTGTAPEAVGETEDDGGNIATSHNEALSGLLTSYAAEPKELLAPQQQKAVPVPIFLGPNPNGPRAYIDLAARLVPSAPAAAEEPAPAPKKKQKADNAPKAKPKAKKPDATAGTTPAVPTPRPRP